MTEQVVRIATRGSQLALVQAGLVATALERTGHVVVQAVIETDGDRRAPDTAWGEGAFVAAIETALLDGRADMAVHSAKDVPIERDSRLTIAAYLPRADPRDALVVRRGVAARRLADLPPGSRVGTDSPRRTGFIRALRPDLDVHPLHGNVDSRLARLDDGATDALVLACAGLERLGRGDRIVERLDPMLVPPAPGQGAIAVQVRADDDTLLRALTGIDDRHTRQAVEVERAFLEAIGGGCRAPVGALANVEDDGIHLFAGCTDPGGHAVRFGRRHGPTSSGRHIASDLARELQREPDAQQDRIVGRAPRVIITRPAAQSRPIAERLRSNGLRPISVPAIVVEILRDETLVACARDLAAYRWVVVTSTNGAQAVLEACIAGSEDPSVAAWAVIGTATCKSLAVAGVSAAFQPSRSAAETLASELPLNPGDRVLVARSDLAGDGVATRLRARGAAVDDVVAYRTIEAPAGSAELLGRALDAGPIDAVLFTSASTVRGFLAIGHRAGREVTAIPAVCTGPTTAAEARAAGFDVLATAARQDSASLASTAAAALFGSVQEVS